MPAVEPTAAFRDVVEIEKREVRRGAADSEFNLIATFCYLDGNHFRPEVIQYLHLHATNTLDILFHDHAGDLRFEQHLVAVRRKTTRAVQINRELAVVRVQIEALHHVLRHKPRWEPVVVEDLIDGVHGGCRWRSGEEGRGGNGEHED